MHIISEDSNRICRHLKKIIKKFFPKNKKIKFINIGSGYGHVDLILKKNLPQMDMHLLEISEEKMKMTTFYILVINIKNMFILHHIFLILQKKLYYVYSLKQLYMIKQKLIL
jgi:16S rRNA G1207 methylase RsmC